MSNRIKDEARRKLSVSITFEREELDYIDSLAEENRVSRSQEIRAIIRGHMTGNSQVEANLLWDLQKPKEIENEKKA